MLYVTRKRDRSRLRCVRRLRCGSPSACFNRVSFCRLYNKSHEIYVTRKIRWECERDEIHLSLTCLLLNGTIATSVDGPVGEAPCFMNEVSRITRSQSICGRGSNIVHRSTSVSYFSIDDTYQNKHYSMPTMEI